MLSLSYPKIKDPKIKEPTPWDNEHLDAFKMQRPIPFGPSRQDPKIKDPKIKDPKIKDPKIKDPKIKDPKIKDPKIKEQKIGDQHQGTMNIWMPSKCSGPFLLGRHSMLFLTKCIRL
jgi:hypothetical protein